MTARILLDKILDSVNAHDYYGTISMCDAYIEMVQSEPMKYAGWNSAKYISLCNNLRNDAFTSIGNAMSIACTDGCTS